VSRTIWTGIRAAGAVLLLAVVLLRVGGGPFLAGLRAVDPVSLLAVAALTGLTTVAAAWRWQAVAGGLGDRVPLPGAVAAYYRSQFLNSVLPGGMVGDLHRGVERGRRRSDVPDALRAVAWDRVLGQAVQAAAAVAVLLLTGWAPPQAVVVLLAATALIAGVAVVLGLLRGGRSGATRRLRPALPRALAASVVTTAGHTAVFLVAARAAGVRAAPAVLVPLALLVLVAMAIPLSVAGWGVREGASAWLFGAAGLGADAGVTVATAYGTMALVAVLPGAAVLLVDRIRAPRGKEGR
jgi:glycosyltransferase 2 family protein